MSIKRIKELYYKFDKTECEHDRDKLLGAIARHIILEQHEEKESLPPVEEQQKLYTQEELDKAVEEAERKGKLEGANKTSRFAVKLLGGVLDSLEKANSGININIELD